MAQGDVFLAIQKWGRHFVIDLFMQCYLSNSFVVLSATVSLLYVGVCHIMVEDASNKKVQYFLIAHNGL